METGFAESLFSYDLLTRNIKRLVLKPVSIIRIDTGSLHKNHFGVKKEDDKKDVNENKAQVKNDFGKRFVPQQEQSNEQVFWLQTSHPNTDQSASSPVKIEALRELPKEKCILVIVDDYYQFTWVRFLASKDELPDFKIKFLKMIQVRWNATVKNIHTDNGTEFVNQLCVAIIRVLVSLIKHQKTQSILPHVFEALCYPNNDSEDLGKLQDKADIGIFIG
nr:hypothetical protein [Tanacetum cinerariifolium]